MDANYPKDMKKIVDALNTISQNSSRQTDGKWLESLTVECAEFIPEWDLYEIQPWEVWASQRPEYSVNVDIGIDVVSRRKSDDELVAIQCKSRKLDSSGHGGSVTKSELDKFIATSSRGVFKERWVITNGDVSLGKNAVNAAGPEKPIKWVNIHSDLLKHKELNYLTPPPNQRSRTGPL